MNKRLVQFNYKIKIKVWNEKIRNKYFKLKKKIKEIGKLNIPIQLVSRSFDKHLYVVSTNIFLHTDIHTYEYLAMYNL